MKLADLRKLAIRKQITIRFATAGGVECVIGMDGVARVPDLRRAPDFNIEQELASASRFLLDPPPTAATREQLAAMTEVPTAAAAAHDHEEE